MLLVAVALLLAGCTSGKKQQAAPTSTTPSTSTPAAGPLRLTLATTARGPERGFNRSQAAKRAAPGLRKFLTRYLTVAFLEPAQAKSGWKELLGMFDVPVRTSAKRQLDALALGSAASKVTQVRPGKANARAVVLFVNGHPAAATVKLSFEGIADSAQGSGPVRLRTTLQLLGGQPWRIAGYSSTAGGDAR
ncbi:MAG TPA: hypothetical protein VE776_07905 [Actinomycetota bacterium]|jgi:hypothetical protein|nr:hypothetical protein [Actinomycetota bacterium]